MLSKIKFLIFLLIISSNLYAGGSKVILNNELTLIKKYRNYNPTFSMVIMIKGGIFRETRDNNGIGHLALTTLENSSDILKKIESLGGSFNTSLAADFSEISISIPSKYLSEILPCIEKLFKEKKLDEKIFENEKRITIAKIKAIKDRPDELAVKHFIKATYGDFPYGFDNYGEIDSVEKLKFEDIKNYINNLFFAKNMVVSVAGYFTKEQENTIKKILSEIPSGKRFKINCKNSEITQDEFIEEEHPKIKQAKLYLGYTAPPATSQDYISMKILSEVLGGGMSSVYFNILRKEKGYAYSVGSFYSSKLCNSRFVSYIGLNYKNVKDTLKTFQVIAENPEKYITKQRVENAKNYFMGRILMEAQTNYKTAWYSAFFETLGLGYDFFDNYINGIEKIQLKDVINVAKQYLKPPKTVYILKGK